MKQLKFKTIAAAGILLIVLIALMPAPSYAANTITLSLDDQMLTTDTAPVIQAGRTLVPIRVITENLQCDVAWDKPSKTVTITEADGDILKLIIGSKEGIRAKADGTEIKFQMDVPASIFNGRTMVPIRAVTENLSSKPQIGWSNSLKRVCIYTPEYIREKGIDDVNVHVERLKPTINTSNIKDMGFYRYIIDGERRGLLEMVDVNGICYGALKGAYSINEILQEDTNIFAFKETNYNGDGYQELAFRVGDYGPTVKTYKTVYDKASYHEFLSEIQSRDDYDKSSAEYDRLMSKEYEYEHFSTTTLVDSVSITNYPYPIIKYKGEIYIPIIGGFEDSSFKVRLGEIYRAEYGVTENAIYLESDNYLRQQAEDAAKKAQQEKEQAAKKAAQEAARGTIKAGDTVYATAVFFKCWGTVEQVQGDKAKVNWVQVTGLYGLVVRDFSEIDFMSQASMTGKGIMIGASTWVSLSDLYK